MADNVVLNLGTGGDTVSLEDIGGVKYQLIKLVDATAGSTTRVGTAAAPLRFDPTGSTSQPISGTITAITNPVAVTGTFFQGTQPVSGPLTDAQLRAATVPISGTVTANAGSGTQAVSIATLPALVAGSAAIGKLAANSGVDIGDVDVTSIAAGTNKIGATYDVGGQLQDEVPTLRTVNRAFANASLIGNTTVVAAQGAGVRVRVLSVLVVATLGVTVKFQSATTDITAGFPLGNNGGMVLPYNPHGWFETAANEALNINISIGTATGCQITWVQST